MLGRTHLVADTHSENFWNRYAVNAGQEASSHAECSARRRNSVDCTAGLSRFRAARRVAGRSADTRTAATHRGLACRSGHASLVRPYPPRTASPGRRRSRADDRRVVSGRACRGPAASLLRSAGVQRRGVRRPPAGFATCSIRRDSRGPRTNACEAARPIFAIRATCAPAHLLARRRRSSRDLQGSTRGSGQPRIRRGCHLTHARGRADDLSGWTPDTLGARPMAVPHVERVRRAAALRGGEPGSTSMVGERRPVRDRRTGEDRRCSFVDVAFRGTARWRPDGRVRSFRRRPGGGACVSDRATSARVPQSRRSSRLCAVLSRQPRVGRRRVSCSSCEIRHESSPRPRNSPRCT
jgi:hypothetical protein